MSRGAKQPGFRQSNSWIHTWSSLPLIWLLYLIFLTGTLSFFRAELDYWLQPELHSAGQASEDQALERALGFLAGNAADARHWRIELPGQRNPVMEVNWFEADEPITRGGGQSRQLDPISGEVLEGRETWFAHFLYRMHFDLYGIPREVARWIVGIATMAMLIGLITGIVTHKKILKEFFTFRPHKGQRSWNDAHNATGVLVLPFHLMITLSGLFLLMYLLVPWGVNSMFDGDFRAYMESAGGRGGPEREQVLPTGDLAVGAGLPALVRSLQAQSSLRWPQGVDRIEVDDPAGNAVIELRERGAGSLLGRGRGEELIYQSESGQLTLVEPADPGVARATYNVLAGLHLLRFAGPLQRWLYFLCGLAGTVMVATGAILWVVKRSRKKGSETHRGIRLVRYLNLSTLVGLPLAIVAGLWANRLVPVDVVDRSQWEIRIFFLAWLLSFVHPLFRPRSRAWTEQCQAFAVLALALPLYNVMLGASGLPAALMRGDWILMSTDLVLITLAVVSLIIARMLSRAGEAPAASRRPKGVRSVANQGGVS